jgi:Ca2+-binding EF-hand superfamily protein
MKTRFSSVYGSLEICALHKNFSNYDANKNGRIEKEEFEQILNYFHIFLKKGDIQALIKYFD